MKKQQIPFDFSKWGQDGITCVFEDSPILTLHLNLRNQLNYYGITESGTPFHTYVSSIKMYQEIKPREIWVNEYPRHFGNTYNTKEEAEKYKTSSCVRTIKFREVLDDEQ